MGKTKKKTAQKTHNKKAGKKTNKKTSPKRVVAKKAIKRPAPKKAPQKVVTRKLTRRPEASKRPAGLPEKLRDAALKVLDQRQAEEVFTVDLVGKSSVADYIIIASGRASRQLAAIGHYLEDEFEKLGVERVRVEGASEGNWVLIDAGDVIVHLFRPEVRRYYNLESIWEK
ncbi:MAG: ribosome silencing factor [Alphaproteobacteria bacterium]